MASPIGKISKLADRKNSGERARRRDECRDERRDEPVETIDREAYVTYICSLNKGDLPKPDDFTSKSFKEKNIGRGDLVWLGKKCDNLVGVISTIDGDDALVEIHKYAGKKVISLKNTDVELKQKAGMAKSIEDFRKK